MTIEPMHARPRPAPRRCCSAAITRPRTTTKSSAIVTMTSISPEAIREPEAGRRQVERDRLAGDEVVGRERRELGRSAIGGQHRLARRGPRRLRAAHAHEWRGSRSCARRRRLIGRREPTSWSSATSRSPPTSPSCARRRPTPSLVAYLSSLLARARNRAAGTRISTWRGVRGVLHRAVPGRAVPAALVVAGHARGQRRRDRGDDVVAARPPARRAEPALARGGRPAGQPRLRELLQRVRRQPLRRPGLGQQRLGGRALHRAGRARAAGDLPAVQEHRSTWP